MSLPPLVSIVVPVFNDEQSIEASLRSAMAQTLEAVEILVVDDSSTDDTAKVVARLADADSRIRLLRQPENMTALQARRRGISEAQAPYVMFLDGDDELEKHAAAKAASLAESAGADMVQFGVTLSWANGKQSSGGFEKRLQPRHSELEGDSIVLELFPAGRPAGGQLWKYLFRTELLRNVYSMLPDDLRLARANDLPIAYLAAATARRFISTPEKLYRYYFQRGGSGNLVENIAQFEFLMRAVDSIDSIADALQRLAYHHSDPQALLDSYASARLSLIGTLFRYLNRVNDGSLLRSAIAMLEERTSRIDLVRAAAQFQPEFIPKLAQHSAPDALGASQVTSVLLTTSVLTTGGVSAVLLAQARVLIAAGYRVTIVAQREGSDRDLVPAGATFHELTGAQLTEKLEQWAHVCSSELVEVVIEHRVLYSRFWPAFALMARANGAATIGWIHNFAGRPTYDMNDLHSFMIQTIPVLAQLVVLSPLDVAFWKLRGIANTAYLPNPPSPLLQEHGVMDTPRTRAGGPIELVWVGRLDEHTKQVRALLDVAQELKVLQVDFNLSVIGPEWPGLTIDEFNAEAAKRGIDDFVRAVGPITGQPLIEALDRADAFVGTSVIEGYQLTLVEAQSRGLPVFMYEMPWLLPVQDNVGVVSVEQGNAKVLAYRIAQTMDDPEVYSALSAGSLAAAKRATSYDFNDLYERLVQGQLPAEYSPVPTLDDAADLLDLTVFFAERNAGVLQQLKAANKSASNARRSTARAQAQISQLEGDVRKLQSVSASHPVRPKATPWQRNLRRIKRRAERLLTPKVLQVTKATIAGDELRLSVSLDRHGAPLSLHACRDVAGVVERHAFALRPDSTGTLIASLKWQDLGTRRWYLAGDLQGKADEHVRIPFQPGARCTSDSGTRVRTFTEGTLQVVSDR